MKVNPVYTILIVAIAALLAWGGYAIQNHEELKLYVGIVMFFLLALTGTGCLGLRYPQSRSGVMARVACGTAFILALAMDYIFACFRFSVPFFMILNGLLLLLTALVVLGVARSGE